MNDVQLFEVEEKREERLLKRPKLVLLIISSAKGILV